MAFFGIALLLLPGGPTSHSQLRIPFNLHESSQCNVSKNSELKDLLRQVILLIWDEVPMQHCFCFEVVDWMLQDIQNNNRLFGGPPVIMGGDFAQILPVVRRGTRATIVGACIQRSFIWPRLSVLFLRQNMRLLHNENSREFGTWLQILSHNPQWRNCISLPPFLRQTSQINVFYKSVFPWEELQQAGNNPGFFRDRVILTFWNDVVAKFNKSLLIKLPGEVHTYDSVDSVDINEDETDHTPQIFLPSQTSSGLPPSRLNLKVGAPIILLRNLHPASGECNGTRMIITRLGRRCIEARILGGEFHGQLRLIPRIKLTTTKSDMPYILSRRQYPIRLCFAMTVNKSQGQSLKTVGVDLRTSAFTHGQLYVALSQVTSAQRVTVLFSENGDGKANNVVYPEVLLRPPQP